LIISDLHLDSGSQSYSGVLESRNLIAVKHGLVAIL